MSWSTRKPERLWPANKPRELYPPCWMISPAKCTAEVSHETLGLLVPAGARQSRCGIGGAHGGNRRSAVRRAPSEESCCRTPARKRRRLAEAVEMKATTAIYARISLDRADEGGVERQLEDCRALV